MNNGFNPPGRVVQVWTSNLYAVPSPAAALTIPHPMGKVLSVGAVLVCVTTDTTAGWTAGDEVELLTSEQSGSGNANFGIGWNQSNVFLTFYTTPGVWHKTTSNPAAIVNANWRIKVNVFA